MCAKMIRLVVSGTLALAAVPCVAGAQVDNLVGNGSFEEDEAILNDPAGDAWWTWGYDAGENSTVAVDETESIDGTRSLRVEPRGATNWYFIVANSPIPLQVGETYSASLWAKAEAPRPLTLRLKATDNSVTWGDTDFQLGTEWAECAMTSQAMNAVAKLEVFCAGSEIPFWFDFVFVYEGDYVAGIRPSRASRAQSADPDPAADAYDVPRDVVLGWRPGQFAASHDVYLGTRFEDVNSVGRTDPGSVLVSQGQTATTYDPAGLLAFGQTYYWRVDEVNAPPDGTIHRGNVWSFTVEPYAYAVTPKAATASSRQHKTLFGPEKTIDRSGLNAMDQHSTNIMDMWLSSTSAPDPTWIQYEFDQVYKMHEMWVWNSNQSTEGILVNYGAREVAIDVSMDGTTWTAVSNVPEFAQGTARADYVHNTTVNLGGLLARTVRLTIKTSWGGSKPFSLSEVRFFQAPTRAFQPDPMDGTTGVALDATLSWRPGREAARHEVYFGTDPNALVLSKTVTEHQVGLTSLAPGHGKTYFWKVNEVNEAAIVPSWTSDVLWSFSTAEYEVVDDFDSYNDRCNRVYYAWKGGSSNGDNAECGVSAYSGNGTGSAVGNNDPPYAERTIVHSGRQSMPLGYNGTSEATRTFDAPQDWARGGIQVLTLAFYGASTNSTGLPMWVQLTDQANQSARVTYGTGASEDVIALAEPAWTEWAIPLTGFVGVDLTRVASITIGFGPGTGSGRVLVDDIRLYPSREQTLPPEPVLVGHWKLDGNAQDSSGNANAGTLMGGPAWVAAGRIGGALDLDGVDDYVDCGAGVSLDITDRVTVSAWIRPDDVGNSEHNEFVAKGDHAYAIKHNSSNRLEFFIYDGAWYSANLAVEGAAFNGQWHHVAGTYDGTQVKLYIDGALVASSVHQGVIASTTYKVNIGRNTQETTRFYDGQIDEVRIYRGALSRSEIGKLAAP